MCSVTFHIIAITCVVWSLYVLIDRTAEEIKQGQATGMLLAYLPTYSLGIVIQSEQREDMERERIWSVSVQVGYVYTQTGHFSQMLGWFKSSSKIF